MALMKCTECSREVSSKAYSCPHCGCPINEEPRRVEHADSSIVTTQETSKELKFQQAFGFVLIAVAGGWFYSTYKSLGTIENQRMILLPLCLGIAGLLIFFTARVQAWWHHK